VYRGGCGREAEANEGFKWPRASGVKTRNRHEGGNCEASTRGSGTDKEELEVETKA